MREDPARAAELGAVRVVRIGSCELVLGDSKVILPRLGQFDALVTDPPYGIGESSGKKWSSRSRGKTPSSPYSPKDWDNETQSEAVGVARGLSKWCIIFGGNYYELPPTTCWLVWDKLNTGDFADCELAWTNLKKAVRRIQWRWNGFIRQGSDIREHPTQKPLGVMAWCLDQLPGDVRSILDPFAGSGTTGVAAVQAGLEFTGIEQEADYFDIMCRRICEAYAAPRLDLVQSEPADIEPVPGLFD